MDLLRAGVGDIVAKIPARMDWILSHIVTGEYICDFVWNDMKDLLKEILLKSKDILNRERNAIKTLMEAHLVSGINMVIMGNSRPASGAEHMVSHLIEMFHEEKEEMPPFHGLTVMIGVFVSMKAYEALVEKKEIPLKDYSIEERRKELLELFEERKVEEFLKTYAEKKFPKIEADIVREPMESIYKEFFPHLKRTLETIDVNSVINSYSKDFLSRVVRLANTIRDRFTVLDVFDEMKILKNFSEMVF